MATHPEVEKLKKANREVRAAVQDCRNLLARSQRLLRQTGQDNDAPRH